MPSVMRMTMNLNHATGSFKKHINSKRRKPVNHLLKIQHENHLSFPMGQRHKRPILTPYHLVSNAVTAPYPKNFSTRQKSMSTYLVEDTTPPPGQSPDLCWKNPTSESSALVSPLRAGQILRMFIQLTQLQSTLTSPAPQGLILSPGS